MPQRTLAAVALVVAGLAGGCGNDSDEREAGEAVTRFADAVARGDGQAACEELTEEAASSLDEEPGATCETEVVKLDVSPSAVADATIAVTSGEVDLVGGGTFFLDETSQGWKVSAAGCEPRPGQPYDCQLEG